MSIYHGFEYQHEKYLALGEDKDEKAREIDWKPVVVGCAFSGALLSVAALIFLLFY